MKIDGDTKLILIGGGVLLLGALYAAKKLEGVLPYVNPADSNNIVNRGVSDLGAWITGKDDWTLGAQIYDWQYGNSTSGALSANPASTDNVIYRWNNFLGQKITGDENWSIGTGLYDLFH